MSSPRTGIVHLSMPITDPTDSAESLLRPYLNAVLSLTRSESVQTLFTAFYIQRPLEIPTRTSDGSSASLIITPCPSHMISECADSAATSAEAVFWKAVPVLQALRRRERHQTRGGVDAEVDEEIDSFWPALDLDGEQDQEDTW
jgi:hypothetical protein